MKKLVFWICLSAIHTSLAQYESLSQFLQTSGTYSQPLIIVYQRFILILPEGLRLSSPPDFVDPVPQTSNFQSPGLPTSHPPIINLKPSRQSVRQPILHPPPPPLHLLAQTLFTMEENEEDSPPELRPKPPKPPPVPHASQTLKPIRPGMDSFLPLPPPRNKFTQQSD